MIRTGCTIVLTVMLFILAVLPQPAQAFWGIGEARKQDASGLDLVQGYDRNTVTTVQGRVTAPPDTSGDPVTVDLQTGSEQVTIVLGPRWYLQDDNLGWKNGDEVTVRGAKAIGKNGKTYLLAQWISAPGGGQLNVRNDHGRPAWAGGTRLGLSNTGSGTQQRGSAGNRRGR